MLREREKGRVRMDGGGMGEKWEWGTEGGMGRGIEGEKRREGNKKEKRGKVENKEG